MHLLLVWMKLWNSCSCFKQAHKNWQNVLANSIWSLHSWLSRQKVTQCTFEQKFSVITGHKPYDFFMYLSFISFTSHFISGDCSKMDYHAILVHTTQCQPYSAYDLRFFSSLIFTSFGNKITVCVIYKKRTMAIRRMLSGEIDRRWAVSNRRPSSPNDRKLSVRPPPIRIPSTNEDC